MANEALRRALEAGRWLTGPEAAQAFAKVPREPFVARRVARFAAVDAALPYMGLGERVQPSPRTHALVLQLLELRRGQRVLVSGARSGWLAGLAAAVTGPGRVTLLEPDAAEAEAAERALEEAGLLAGIEVLGGLDDLLTLDAAFDRVVALTPVVTLEPAYRDLLADRGFLLAAVLGEEQFGIMKMVRSGSDYAELRLANVAVGPEHFRQGEELPSGALRPHPRDRGRSFTLGHLLSLESLAMHVWQGRVVTRDDAYFREGIERVWGPRNANAEEPLAKNLFHLGYVHQSVGDLATAAALYSASLDAMPSSEAYTFRGWACSFLGRVEDAIRDCEAAITVDPTFGNPYNDIGAYLIELGRLDEAVPWLERAKAAKRYDSLFYPYCNLGRVYMAKGEREKARAELQRALEINPHYSLASELLRRLEGSRY